MTFLFHLVDFKERTFFPVRVFVAALYFGATSGLPENVIIQMKRSALGKSFV